jgi:hypothetical protein
MRDLGSQRGLQGTALSGPDVGGLVRDLLRDGLPVKVSVTGSSMVPFIRAGDVVTLRPGAEAFLGGVIAYLRPGARLVVHRVVALSGAGVVTRGDASPETDGPVGWGDVLGHVSGVERGGKPLLGLGFGPERALIAVLSRWGLLQVGIRLLVGLKRRVVGRSGGA